MTGSSDDPMIATRAITQAGRTTRRLRTYQLELRTPDGQSVSKVVDVPLLRAGSREGNDLVIADDAVSRLHFEIEAGPVGYRLRDLESTNGTYVDGYRVGDLFLRPGSVIRVGNTKIAFQPLETEREVPTSHAERFGPLVGGSTKMRELYSILERAAPTDATVLVEGETGTGKELVARALHEHSKRAGGPLVVFDCAAVASNLVESELFGHEKGSFTGAASRRIGRLEEADGGTLFIDELGELPLDLQPKLLRALERREVRRVGGKETIPVDIRIVAATHRDLAREVNRGAFREDLYYRLAVVRVQIAPLRERPDDIRALVEHFIRTSFRDDPKRSTQIISSVSEANWQKLGTHPWPGNVRQLRNVIDRSLALSGEDDLEAIDPPTLHGTPAGGSGPSSPGGPVDLERPFVDQKAETIARFEESYLRGQLDRHDGNISRAAAAAGIDRMYFKRLLKKYR